MIFYWLLTLDQNAGREQNVWGVYCRSNLMLLYFTKYIATITAAVTLNVILFMKNISSQISSVWSQSVDTSIYTNNRLALCQSGSFYLISSHLYQVDSFSFFSWRDSALPTSLPPWFLWCFNDEQHYCCPGRGIFEAFCWGQILHISISFPHPGAL